MTIRFQQSNEPKGKPRGYVRSYAVANEGRLRWSCDVTNDLWPAVRFVAPHADRPEFSIVPTRRVMALSYRVVAADDEVVGIISRTLITGSRWKLEDAAGDEVARVVNPASWPKALFEQAVDHSAMRFAFLHDDALLGFVERRSRPRSDKPGNRFQRWVRRYLTVFDWTLELEPDLEQAPDLRLLVAATLLLLELDIHTQG